MMLKSPMCLTLMGGSCPPLRSLVMAASMSTQGQASASTDASGPSSSTPPARRGSRPRKKYSPQVLEYFQHVKQWNKQMHELRSQWRVELLTSFQEQGQQAMEISSTPSHPQHPQASIVHQAEMMLKEELRKAELQLEVAHIKLEKAKAFQQQQDRHERQLQLRRHALLEASRTWIRREELLDRIEQALDNPRAFGFVTPMTDAKKAL